MTLQFPANPSTGQTFTASNNLVYRWDGEKWITLGSANAGDDPSATYVKKAGDTMTGDLIVNATVDMAGVDGPTFQTGVRAETNASNNNTTLFVYGDSSNTSSAIVVYDGQATDKLKVNIDNQGNGSFATVQSGEYASGLQGCKLHNGYVEATNTSSSYNVFLGELNGTETSTIKANGNAIFGGTSFYTADTDLQVTGDSSSAKLTLNSPGNTTYSLGCVDDGGAHFALRDESDSRNVFYIDSSSNLLFGGTLPASPATILSSDGDIQSTSQNSGQLAGFRSAIINGNFSVNQHGLGPYPASGSYETTSDRWKVASQGGPQVQVTIGNGAYESNRLNVNQGNIWVGTGIELPVPGKTSLFNKGSKWTFSVWADAGKTIQCEITYTTGILGSTLTTVDTANLTETTVGSNGKVRYQKTVTFPDAAIDPTSLCLAIGLRCTTAVDYSLVQFEPGTVATPFEAIPYQMQLANCERYYQLVPRIDLFCATPSPTQFLTANLNFRTAMRVAPDLVAAQDVRVSNVSFSNQNNYGLTISGETSSLGESSYMLNVSLDAEL